MSDRMNPVAKALWLTALRSGDYLQAKGVLKGERYHYEDDSDEEGTRFLGHCCLGVLSEVAPPECGKFEAEPFDPQLWTFFQPDGSAENGLLPKTVRDWSGVEGGTGFVVIGTYQHELGYEARLEVNLAELNDSYGLTFAQIADVVEYAL